MDFVKPNEVKQEVCLSSDDDFYEDQPRKRTKVSYAFDIWTMHLSIYMYSVISLKIDILFDVFILRCPRPRLLHLKNWIDLATISLARSK